MLHYEELGKGNGGGVGFFEACRFVEGKVVGGMHLNVVLPARTKVEDGAWTFMVIVTVIREDEENRHLRTLSQLVVEVSS